MSDDLKILKFLQSIVLLFIAFYFVCSVSKGWAIEEKSIIDQRGEPFSPSNLQNNSICKYAKPTEHYGHEGRPALFRDINDIYIYVVGSVAVFPREVWDQPPFQSKNIATLAACVLEKHLRPAFMADRGITIYTPDLHYVRLPDVRKDRNLTIIISMDLFDNSKIYKNLVQEYGDIFKEKDVVVQAQYYRSDVHEPTSLSHCAVTFPYVTDIDLHQKLLTSALHRCLNHQYQ